MGHGPWGHKEADMTEHINVLIYVYVYIYATAS